MGLDVVGGDGPVEEGWSDKKGRRPSPDGSEDLEVVFYRSYTC